MNSKTKKLLLIYVLLIGVLWFVNQVVGPVEQYNRDVNLDVSAHVKFMANLSNILTFVFELIMLIFASILSWHIGKEIVDSKHPVTFGVISSIGTYIILVGILLQPLIDASIREGYAFVNFESISHFTIFVPINLIILIIICIATYKKKQENFISNP